MVNWIIFSKDRAMQLDLLLRSMHFYTGRQYQSQVNVLYTASTAKFVEGYGILKKLHPEVRFILQNDFKVDFENLIDSDAEFVGTLCDDDVFVNKFKLTPAIKYEGVVNYSLRLHPQMSYCYNLDLPMKPTHKVNWQWGAQKHDFGYPFSVSGTVWQKNILIELIKPVYYYHPNSLEDYFDHSRPIKYPLLCCNSVNSTVNIPSNMVQRTHYNRTMNNYTVEELNNKLLQGFCIDHAPLKGLKTNSCFIDYNYSFLKRYDT